MSTKIQIPEELESELKRRIADTEFESLEDYVLFVLREIVDEDELREESSDTNNRGIEDRLEDLGYL